MTPKQMTEACKAARIGHTQPACAAKAGVDASTLWRWRKNSEEFRIAFDLAMTEGRAALENRALALADKDDGRHAIELLSRRYPKAWGRSDRVKVDAKVTTTGLDSMTKAEQLAALDRMRAALTEDD